MGRKNFNAFIKHQKAEKKRKKKAEKREKLAQQKNEENADFQDMIAFVDDDGNIVDEPPEDLDLGGAKLPDKE